MSPSAQTIALAALAAFVASALLTPLVIRLARQNGWVAHPSEDRWHEQGAVALMGGTAIFAAVVVTLLMTGATGALRWPVAAAAGLLFVVGAADDIRGLSPSAKLLAQVAAAALTIYGGLLFWGSGPSWLSGPLTFLWVIGITNAFNLIDGMDGLAAGIAVIAAGTLAIIAAHLGAPLLAGLAAAVAGAAGGFLLYNTYPASVFMGDGGSLFVGYALAALSIAVQNGPEAVRPGAAFIPVVVMAVPIFDVTLVTVLRVANGRSITRGGTDHSMHRLAFLGLSERQTVFLMYGVSACLGAVALLLYTDAALLFGALVLAATAALLVLGSHIGRADVYAGDGAASPPAVLATTGRTAPPTFTEKFGAVMQELVGRYWKRAGGLLADMLVVIAAFLMAHALRFPGGVPEEYHVVMLSALPLVAGGKVAVFYAMGVYHRLWPQAGTPEMIHLAKAVLLTSGLAFLGVHAVYDSAVVSASALVVDMLLTGVGIAATRFGFRAIRQYIVHKQRSGERVLICGADAEGMLVMRSLSLAALDLAPLHVAGFLDDDARHHGRRVKGVPVLGALEDLDAICEREHIDGIVVNSVNHSDEQVDRIRERCRRLGRQCYCVTLGLDVLTGEEDLFQPSDAPFAARDSTNGDRAGQRADLAALSATEG